MSGHSKVYTYVYVYICKRTLCIRLNSCVSLCLCLSSMFVQICVCMCICLCIVCINQFYGSLPTVNFKPVCELSWFSLLFTQVDYNRCVLDQIRLGFIDPFGMTPSRKLIVQYWNLSKSNILRSMLTIAQIFRGAIRSSC